MALSRNYPSPKHSSRRGILRARSPTCCRRCNGLPSCQAEATHPGHIQLGRPILLTAARLKTTRLSLSCATWHDCSSPARSPQTSNPTVGIMRIDGTPAAVFPSGHSHSRGDIAAPSPLSGPSRRYSLPFVRLVRHVQWFASSPKRWSDHWQSAAHIKSAGGCGRIRTLRPPNPHSLAFASPCMYLWCAYLEAFRT